MIPRYALGNWWSKNDEYSETEIAHFIKKCEEQDVPISLFILNKWQNNNSFSFNEKYKDPKYIADYLHSKKIKLGLSIDDPVNFNNVDVINKLKSYLQTDSKGNIPFNLYDPRTIDAFLKILIH